MRKALLPLLLMTFALPIGCKFEDDTPDPLGRRVGFCEKWAENACQDKVVSFCQASSAKACQSAQSDFCLGIVPEDYSSKHAVECLDAVKDAYSDGDLTAEELQIVTKLGAPCDQLSKGSSSKGESCSANDECATADDYSCIKKLGASDGTCGKPEVVGPGEACDGPTQVCREGNFCNGENCVAYKKPNAVCEGDYQCKPTDHCLKDPTVDIPTGNCTVRGEVDSDCVNDEDCQSNYCVVASGDATGTCTSLVRLGRLEPLCDNLH